MNQKDNYLISNKYSRQKKQNVPLDATKNDRYLGDGLNKTQGSPQNRGSISTTQNQFSNYPQTHMINKYSVKNNYINTTRENTSTQQLAKTQSTTMRDSLINIKLREEKNINLERNSSQNNNNKQIQHRRLKQNEDQLKSISQINRQSQSYILPMQSQSYLQPNSLQIGEDLNEKQLKLKEFSSPQLQKTNRQMVRSLKSINFIEGLNTQRNSQTAIPSLKSLNQSKKSQLFSSTQKITGQSSLVNLDFEYNQKRIGNSETNFSQPFDSYQSLNEDLTQKFDLIDKIESKQYKTETTFNPEDYFRIKPPKTVRKQNVNIINNQTINSQLVSDGIKNILRCEINEFLYFKIKVFEKSSPLRVKFLVENNQSSLKLYVSRSCIQPNNFNCDFVFNNTKTICIEEEKNQSVFTKFNFLYFSIVSDQDQDIQIKYTFGNEIKRPYNNEYSGKPSLNNIPQSENVSSMDPQKLRQSVIDIQQEKVKKLNENGNFIQNNIKEINQIDCFTKNLAAYSKKKETYSHLMTVIQKAAELKQKKQTKIEIEYESKLKKQIDKIKKFRGDFFSYFWIQFVNQYSFFICKLIFYFILKIYLVNLTKIINDRYKEKKEVIQNFSKIAWRAVPLANKFRKFRSKYPRDLFLNNLRYAKIGMETLANIIKEKKQKEVGKLLAKTFRYNHLYSGLWVKMNRFYRIVITVQQSYKIFRVKKANFKKLLLKLWDKQDMIITLRHILNIFIVQRYYLIGMEQTIEVKKTEENEQLFWRKKQNILSQINIPEIKTYAIDQYFTDQIYDFRQKIGTYLQNIRNIPKEQKRKIKILQAFLNDEELNRKSQIFENYNEEDADELDVSMDDVGNKDQTHKATNFIKKPRLFIVPTFKSIKSVYRKGVLQYASQNPNILELITIKQF